MKQLDLKFKGRPAIDPSFKSWTVVLFKNRFSKNGVWVFDIWAKSREQAIVKAAEKVRMQHYSIKHSLARLSRP